MQKYYVLGFPENQEFTDNENCYWIADGMMLAVPCELYDSKNNIMEKIYVQRLVSLWIEEEFKVPEISEENIDKAVNYEIDISSYGEVFWDTQESLGPIEVYDHNRNLLKKYE